MIEGALAESYKERGINWRKVKHDKIWSSSTQKSK
jgi:hypothetical protein